MALFDDDPATQPRISPIGHQIGQDVSLLSVDDLEGRIGQLRDEIARLEAELRARGSTRQAAEALFRR